MKQGIGRFQQKSCPYSKPFWSKITFSIIFMQCSMALYWRGAGTPKQLCTDGCFILLEETWFVWAFSSSWMRAGLHTPLPLPWSIVWMGGMYYYIFFFLPRKWFANWIFPPAKLGYIRSMYGVLIPGVDKLLGYIRSVYGVLIPRAGNLLNDISFPMVSGAVIVVDRPWASVVLRLKELPVIRQPLDALDTTLLTDSALTSCIGIIDLCRKL